MIFDFNNLRLKTALLPINRAAEFLKTIESKAGGDVFMALDGVLQRRDCMNRVDNAKVMPAVMYLYLLAHDNHPQPEKDFLEVCGIIPYFILTELISETMSPEQIMYIIK